MLEILIRFDLFRTGRNYLKFKLNWVLGVLIIGTDIIRSKTCETIDFTEKQFVSYYKK